MAGNNPLHEKLLKRHKERVEKIERRRQARLKEKNVSGENASVFLEDFNKEKREILAALNGLNSLLSRTELSTLLDEISKKSQHLQKYVSDSSLFLPSYDVRRALEILTQIRADINEKREEYLPKKKFTFKSRQKLKAATNVEIVAENNKPVEGSDVLKNVLGFSDISGESLTLMPEECNKKDINLSNLADCSVYIYGYPSQMRLQNVINSEIYCGPVSRSIFIIDCYDSSFHLAGQQMRIHSTVNTKFYIHVTSKAIIEDCEDVGFACYRWEYQLMTQHFKEAGLDIATNHWNEIDDFNWLKLDQKSPNWYILD